MHLDRLRYIVIEHKRSEGNRCTTKQDTVRQDGGEGGWRQRGVARSGWTRRAPARRTHAPGRDPHRAAQHPRRGARSRLRRDPAPRGEERRRLATEPRLGLSDPATARGRRPRPLDRAGRQADLRDHRRGPGRSRTPNGPRPAAAPWDGREGASAFGQLREGAGRHRARRPSDRRNRATRRRSSARSRSCATPASGSTSSSARTERSAGSRRSASPALGRRVRRARRATSWARPRGTRPR